MDGDTQQSLHLNVDRGIQPLLVRADHNHNFVNGDPPRLCLRRVWYLLSEVMNLLKHRLM